MKKLLTIIALLAIVGCGSKEVLLQGLDGAPGLNGADGANGADGKDGLNSLCTISKLDAEQEVCQSSHGIMLACGLDADRDFVLDPEEMTPASLAIVCDGAPGPQGPEGPVGPAGKDGSDGSDGQDGQSCYLEDTEAGATITCGESQTEITDGQNGQDGSEGEDGEDGSQGPTGPQGPIGPAGPAGALLTSYNLTTSCQSVGDGLYAKMFGATAKIYNKSGCDSSDKVADLVSTSDEVYMTGNLMLVLEASKLFKIKFN